jgi:acetylglutamate kinase
MTRVIKVGGRPQTDPSLAGTIASEWQRDKSLVLVHGGGDEVSSLQKAFGLTASFVGGRRVTTERDVDLVRMALSGSANKRLVSALVGEGVNAVGLSGEDAALIAAQPVDAEQLGYVGSPGTVNIELLRHLISGGYMPVISPVSRDGSGTMGVALNVNGDDAAAAIAVAIRADELLLVADVEGVMSDGAVVGELSPMTAKTLMENGTAAGGMRAKLEAGLAAIAGGVPVVRISDIAAIADASRGTVLRAIGELS